MLRIEYYEETDTLYVQWAAVPIGRTRELDSTRLVDYTLDTSEPIGVDFLSVSQGVRLDGLPKRELLSDLLHCLKIKIIDQSPQLLLTTQIPPTMLKSGVGIEVSILFQIGRCSSLPLPFQLEYEKTI